MSVVKAVIEDVVFEGDVHGLFDPDPLGLGGVGSAALARAVCAVRDAVKAKVEAEGLPYPSSFDVSVDVTEDADGETYNVRVAAVNADG